MALILEKLSHEISPCADIPSIPASRPSPTNPQQPRMARACRAASRQVLPGPVTRPNCPLDGMLVLFAGDTLDKMWSGLVPAVPLTLPTRTLASRQGRAIRPLIQGNHDARSTSTAYRSRCRTRWTVLTPEARDLPHRRGHRPR